MPQHSVFLLGSFHVQCDGVAVTRFGGDKVRALLAYLATEADRPHARGALAGLFWPDQPDDHALRNLTQSLVRLRRAFGAGADPIHTTRQTVQWRSEAADVDVTAFARLARSIEFTDLARAAMLYRGEFLPGFASVEGEAFDDWLLLTRERLRHEALAVLHTVTARHLAAGQFTHAAEAARRQLALDPWREEAHRQLMRALAGAGDRAAALAAYKRCRQLLRDDLGVEPDDETRALADELHAGARSLARSSPPTPPTAVPPPPPSHNLPAPLASFVGREGELARLTTLLDGDTREITLVGAGGVGKTRLALAAAWALHPRYADGVWWVPLAGFQPGDSPALQRTTVATAIATALGIALDGRRDARRALTVALRERTALLVLDNCEHLPEVAAVAGALLAAAPSLRVIATAREPLGLSGEMLLRLGGLPVPPAGSDATDYPSVRLFRERASRHAPGWEQGERAEVEGVARLCRLLDGLPLGIELAAHWAGHYTPDEIVTTIEGNPDFLAARTRDVPDRHRSLRAMFDYTWRLLTPSEQQALTRLAVFRGAFDRAAAEAVATVRGATLATLVDKSLLEQTGVGRYGLHALLRQFAAERRATGLAAPSLDERHAAYYLALAEEAAPKLVGPEQAAWTERLDRNLDNLRAALGWARASGQAEMALRLAGALSRFWATRGYTREGRAWLEDALALAPAAAAAVRAQALSGAGILANLQGDLIEAARWLEESIARYHEADDPVGAARALNTLGGVAYDQGDLAGAVARYEECLMLARAAGDPGEIARALANLGEALYHRGDLADAAARYDEALALAQRAGRADVEAYVLGDLGNVALQRGDRARARALHREALVRKRALGAQRQIAITLEDLAALAAAEGQGERAARLLGAAQTLRATIGAPQPVPEGIAAERAVAGVRAVLGEEAWAAAVAAGRSLTLDEAITDALVPSAPDRPPETSLPR